MKYFLMFYFRNFIFYVKRLEHKIYKLAIKDIYESQDMLNKLHSLVHSATQQI